MPINNPLAQGLINEQDFKQSVRAATTAALPANTRTGNVLDADANGTFPAQDGVTFVVGEPLLVKDEVAGANNGVYDVTDLGSGSTKWKLTRRADFDQDAEVTSGATVFISEGTANAGAQYTLVTVDPITVNTTALVFSQTGGTTPMAHDLGGAQHNADTLANLNTKVSDATLDDSGDPRTPSAHALGGAEHSADTLANLNAKVSDATLDDSGDSRAPNGSASGDLTGSYPGPTVAANAIGNTKLADVATKTIKGRTTAATGDPEDLTAIQARAVLGITLDHFELDADQFLNSVSGDRPASIDNNAPTVADTVNAGIPVLRFDDTDEEARKFSRRIKAGALTMKIKVLWKAQTAPGDTIHDIGWKLYWREIPIGVAPSATWVGTNDGSEVLPEIVNIADDVLPHEVETTLTLASLTNPILDNRKYQFLLSRIAPAGTNLVGDWSVIDLAVEIN